MKMSKMIDRPEIFLSIQGEGKNLGLLSVFVRSSLCNLHCVWCDTDYTWNWVGTPWRHLKDNDPNYRKFMKEDQIIEISASEIADIVIQYRAANVVLTGGEPLLQQESFCSLMKILYATNPSYKFEVETNATIMPSTEFDGLITQYNASPKLPSSGNDHKLRLRPEVLGFLAKSPKAWFKFVCCSTDDIDEVVAFCAAQNIQHDRTFIMPQGISSEHIRSISQELVGPCIDRGFNFTDRLHVHLFKNKRGT